MTTKSPSQASKSLAAGDVSAVGVKVSYTPIGSNMVQALVESGREFVLFMEGLNDAQEGLPFNIRVHRVKFSPGSKHGLSSRMTFPAFRFSWTYWLMRLFPVPGSVSLCSWPWRSNPESTFAIKPLKQGLFFDYSFSCIGEWLWLPSKNLQSG